MFYDKFVKICAKHGVSPSRAAIESGLSKSTVTKWKTTPDAEPTGTALKKLSEYFGISIAELLGEGTEKTPTLTEKDRRNDMNILRIAGRDGSYQERRLSDEQMAALKAILAQMPDAPEDL